MRLKDYLKEVESYLSSSRGNAISKEEALKYIKTKCKKSFKKNRRIWRGIRRNDGSDYSFIDPSQFVRRSAHTSNFYTLLIDNLPSWDGWPKRSKSVVCTTKLETAQGYSHDTHEGVYSIFPFDGVQIGICSDEDIWGSFPVLSKEWGIISMHQFNTRMSNLAYEVTGDVFPSEQATDWSKMVDMFEKVTEMCKDPYKRPHSELAANFDPKKETFLQYLDKLMSPEANKFDRASAGSQLPKYREVWTEGPVIAVRYSKILSEDEFVEVIS